MIAHDAPNTVETSSLDSNGEKGLCVRPAGVSADLARWSAENRYWIDEQILKYGCVLFRGFDVSTAAAFSKAAAAMSGTLFADYGDLPRNAAGERIYESTPYRADQRILFHNESSHLSSWPMRIHFYCVTPASAGGCTPIIDTRAVVNELDSSVLAAFEARGLLYVRNFVEGIQPTWEEFFGTSDRARVEAMCREQGSEFTWRSGGGLTVRQRARAIATHPQTGDRVFFNQIQLHHIACVDEDTREGLLALFDYDELPRHVYYGDGTAIPDDVMRHVSEVYERVCVRFEWKRHDVIVLDNMLTSHGRDSFEGSRQILVALAQIVNSAVAG